MTTGTAYSALVLEVGTGHSLGAVMVPRAFFTYSIASPATMKRASSGSE